MFNFETLFMLKNKTNFICFGDLVIDISINNALEDKQLFDLGFTKECRWLNKLNNEDQFEEILKKSQKKITTGGSLLNTMKTLSQANSLRKSHRNDILLFVPSDFNNEKEFRPLFKSGFKSCRFSSLGTPDSKITVIYIIFDKHGERYFYLNCNLKTRFPTKTEDEWYDILKQYQDKSYRIVVEGFMFYDNKETFVNLIEAANKLHIPVDLLLSNSTRLSFEENKNPVLNLLKKNKISMLIGNNEEFETLFGIEKSSENVISILEKNLSAYKNVTFIITCGENNTLVIDSEFDEKLSVPVYRTKNIVNTNGAGDAFLSGLYYILLNNNMKDNGRYDKNTILHGVNFGHKIASIIIQMDTPNFKDEEEYIEKVLG